ncbi:MAG: hypothetical protein AB1564_17150 [Chloroflexota bacterium]
MTGPSKPVRQYPPVYEKIVPIALTIVVILIIALIVIIFGVALGLIPGAV